MRDARLESRREALGGARALVSFLFGRFRFRRDASRRDARLEIAQSLRALVPLARRRRQHLQARRHAFAGAVAPGVRRRDQRASPPEAQRQAADVRRALALEDGDAPLPEGPARRRAAVRRRRERQLVPAVRARRDVGAPREPGARGGARAGERHDDGIILEEQTLASETRIEFETRRGIRNASVVRVGFPFVFARAPRASPSAASAARAGAAAFLRHTLAQYARRARASAAPAANTPSAAFMSSLFPSATRTLLEKAEPRNGSGSAGFSGSRREVGSPSSEASPASRVE